MQLPTRVSNNILEARAPFTRRLYALKWSVFRDCSARSLAPVSCDVSHVLTFLQELLDNGLTHSNRSIQATLLLALASVKRVGDLQVLSVSASCLGFGPNDCEVVLKPRHGYVPKVLSTPFRFGPGYHPFGPPHLGRRAGSQMCFAL